MVLVANNPRVLRKRSGKYTLPEHGGDWNGITGRLSNYFWGFADLGVAQNKLFAVHRHSATEIGQQVLCFVRGARTEERIEQIGKVFDEGHPLGDLLEDVVLERRQGGSKYINSDIRVYRLDDETGGYVLTYKTDTGPNAFTRTLRFFEDNGQELQHGTTTLGTFRTKLGLAPV